MSTETHPIKPPKPPRKSQIAQSNPFSSSEEVPVISTAPPVPQTAPPSLPPPIPMISPVEEDVNLPSLPPPIPASLPPPIPALAPPEDVDSITYDLHEIKPFETTLVDSVPDQEEQDTFLAKNEDEELDEMERFRKTYNISTTKDDSDLDDADLDDYANKYLQPAANIGRYQSETSTLADGNILYRFSARSFVTKEWNEGYYVIEKGAIYLYHSRDDFKKKPFEKKVDILYNFRASAIKAKEYKGFGNVYNFMLEEVHDFGVTNMGKFGSLNKDAIDLLYKRIRDEVMQKRKERSGAKK